MNLKLSQSAGLSIRAPSAQRPTAARPSSLGQHKERNAELHACSSSSTPEVPSAAMSRRQLLSGVLAAAAAITGAAAAAPPAARAFGSGFPGYDVNLNARKKILQRNRAELQEQVERAAAYKAAKAAEAAAKAAGTAQ